MRKPLHWDYENIGAYSSAMMEWQDARINKLEAAIRKHRDEFPDEVLHGELTLWDALSEAAE